MLNKSLFRFGRFAQKLFPRDVGKKFQFQNFTKSHAFHSELL